MNQVNRLTIKLMFANKYNYFCILFIGLLIWSLINPCIFLGTDNPYNWLSSVFFGIVVLASGPYAFIICKKMAMQILHSAPAVQPQKSPNT